MRQDGQPDRRGQHSPYLTCPTCGQRARFPVASSAGADAHPQSNHVYRRRRCLACDAIHTTREYFVSEVDAATDVAHTLICSSAQQLLRDIDGLLALVRPVGGPKRKGRR